MESIFRFRPNKLTFWASRNVHLAMILIIFIEIIKFGIGFYLGKNFLPILSANLASIVALLAAVTAFTTQNFFAKKAENKSKKTAFSHIFKANLVLFVTSFLLSSLAGNQLKRIKNPTVEATVFATLIEENRDDIDVDSLIKSVEEEQNMQTQKPVKERVTSQDDLKRLGSFLLFVLAMLLTYFGLFLACSAACSGYGLLALFVLLIDVGIFSGGVYFLLKVFRNGKLKQWKEMDKSERKSEWKRYLKTFLFTLGALATFTLLGNILG